MSRSVRSHGRMAQFKSLDTERPQIYIENGEPLMLLCAADTMEGHERHSFNVQIPLSIKKHEVVVSEE